MAAMTTMSLVSSPKFGVNNNNNNNNNILVKQHMSTTFGLWQHKTQPVKRVSFTVQAAKLPPGMVLPKVEPKFKPPFAGFTSTAEVWNSRACMIGLIGTFIVELILNKGILELIGVEIGKGLDIPL